MGNEEATKQLYKGALLLTLAGIMSKILSAGYRIPLQNITGDKGFYIYQQIYPLLGIALILSLYGFPTAISKVISDHGEEKLSIFSFYRPILFLLFIFSGSIFMGLFLNAERIARWMGDPLLFSSIKVVAFVFILIPFTSLLRGVFQGKNNMKPTAVSQISEQLVRVVVILLFAVLLIKQGENLYGIGSGAAIGSIAGAIVAIFILSIIWLRNHPMTKERYTVSWAYYIKTIILYGLFISINHMILLLFQFADAFTLIPSLKTYGFSMEEATIWKGNFDRGQPLIQLGTVIGSSLALAFIPTITKRRMDAYPEQFQSHIQSAFKLSFYLSIAATIGLIIIFPYANTLLYLDNNGTVSIQLLIISIFIASLVITVASILQGLGFVGNTAMYIIIGFIAKWVLNLYLVPLWGITGSALSTVMSAGIVLALNIWKLKRTLPNNRIMVVPWKAFLISIGSMVIYICFLNLIIEAFIDSTSRIGLLVYVLFVSVSGAFMYLILLVRLGGFSKDELYALPFGEILVMVSQRRQ